MKEKKHLTILVEGELDAAVVSALMRNLGVHDQVEPLICRGFESVKQNIKKLSPDKRHKTIALIDSDLISVADAEQYAYERLDRPDIAVYCAVPEIESWVFADSDLIKKWAKNNNAKKTLERLSLPETIPYPKELMRRLLRPDCINKIEILLSEIDLDRAAARSPSLRVFVQAVCEKLGVQRDFDVTPLNTSIGRDTFSTLLRELPENTILWRTLDGNGLSASDLAKQIQEGTVIGKQYATEVLRLARDLIGRRSSK